MKKALIPFLFLACCCIKAAAQNDLTIKKTSDMKIPGMPDLISNSSKSAGRNSRVSTILIKGSRLRVDSTVPSMKLTGLGERELSYIQQCDLGRTVHLDHKKKSYTISNIAGSGTSPKPNERLASAKRGGYIDVSIQVTDTTERRDMFGFVAKHLHSTTTMTPSSDACSKQPMSIQDDGWYIDLPTYSCEIQTEDTMNSMQQTADGCVDEVRVKPGSNMHLGFALQQTRTFSMNGMNFQMLENVVSLDKSSLDTGLFEIPAGFKASGNFDSNVATATGPSAGNQNPPPAPDWTNRPLPQMSQVAGPYTGSTPAKAPGVIRVGVVTPTVDMGQGFEGIDAAEIVRSAFLDKLKGEKIESVPISSGVLITEEAKLKQCDYLLYVDIKRKKGGGGFLKQMLLTNLACMGGNAACAAASAANTASTLGGRMKNKDEVALEYHVNKPDGTSALSSSTLKQKAQKDGDDVLSQMIGESSKNILTTLNTGK